MSKSNPAKDKNLTPTFQVNFKEEKDESQIVYGEVYIPEQIDTDHETMSAEDVEKMAWDFLSSGRVDSIDIQHDLEKSGCTVIESFISRKGWKPFNDGSWVLGVKCTDEAWKQVKSGELNGFSFYGTVKKYPAKVLIEVAKQIVGDTENSTVDIIPDHNHTFIVNIDNKGNIVSGKTDTVLAHSHYILRGTATEIDLDHNHRLTME